MNSQKKSEPRVKDLRRDFPIFRNHPSLVYLDNAATTHKPASIIDLVKSFYEAENANVHRAVYPLAERATSLYEYSRQEIAHFVGADQDEVVFTKGATESLSLLAASLASSGEYGTFVVPIIEHHSNFLPWQYYARRNGLDFVALPAVGAELSVEDLRRSLRDIEGPFVFSIGGLMNSTGYRTPFEEITEIVHSLGGIIVIDGAQLIPHESFDFRESKTDFLVFSGHKMLAETGIGCLVGRSSLIEELSPLVLGGGMVNRVDVEDSSFSEGVSKLEGGTQNIAGAVSLAGATKYLKGIGMKWINDHVSYLTNIARERLAEIPDLTIHSPSSSHAILLFSHRRIHSHDLAEFLGRTQNVAVRSGHHCAQLQMGALGVSSACRASLYLYNTLEDIERLFEGITKAERWFS
ncbi:aminotransferase class V-fold PLP-dependent enzyme [Mesotoga sp.]|uniref:aminotransferase class V-fold PLP-dependent enzyme n=1 Tax=Mesotoga sp. TaxID=2053577 RepID=UPI001BD6A075|nr:aminotransferase class V-fold PLP-dependent enzyme [Mesotoga sp.]